MFKTTVKNIPDYRQNGCISTCDFSAFNSQWQVQIQSRDETKIKELINCIYSEVIRLDEKYSLCNNNIMALINRGTAESLIVDEETAALLDFADACFNLSEGKFDISCFQLQSLDKSIKPHYQSGKPIKSKNYAVSGWHKIRWDNPRIRLLQGMKLNLDSLNSAHAADRALALAEEIVSVPVLIKYSGNVLINKTRELNQQWWINDPFKQQQLIPLNSIAMAFKSNQNNNIFDALTNKPLADKAKVIMVEAESATEANMLATLARLEGRGAEYFLKKQSASYKILF